MTHKSRLEKLEKIRKPAAAGNPYMVMPAGELLQVARQYLAETADQPTNATREYIARRLQEIEGSHES